MTRIGRVLTAGVLLLGAMFAHRLALPGGTFACSCAAPPLGAPAFTGDEQAVFIGTAGRPQPDGTFRFAVERWFKGGDAREVDVASEKQVFADGSTAIDTCGLHFEVGDRVILAASILDGVYVPGTCSPHAAVATDDGQRLLNAAVASFGQGLSPGEQRDPEVVEDSGLDLPTFAIFAVAAVALLVVLPIIVTERRRRNEDGL